MMFYFLDEPIHLLFPFSPSPLILLMLNRTSLQTHGPEMVSKALVSTAAFDSGWNTMMTSSWSRSTVPNEGRLVTSSQVTCEVETEDCNLAIRETLLNIRPPSILDLHSLWWNNPSWFPEEPSVGSPPCTGVPSL